MISYYKSNICTAAVGSEFPFYIHIPGASGRARSVAALESLKRSGNLLKLRFDRLTSGVGGGSRPTHIYIWSVSEQLLTVLSSRRGAQIPASHNGVR
jgi:hypothetical protein